MLKSTVTHVSGSSSSFKRTHPSPTPLSESNDDHDTDYEQRRVKDDDEEEGQISLKATNTARPTQTTFATPSPRTGALGVSPAKRRRLQV